MQIKTLQLYGECSEFPACPSVHDVDVDPGNRYVIAKVPTRRERALFAPLVGDNEVLGWMPSGFLGADNRLLARTRPVTGPGLVHGRQYVILTDVTDAATLTHFRSMIARDELLGTVPTDELAVIG